LFIIILKFFLFFKNILKVSHCTCCCNNLITFFNWAFVGEKLFCFSDGINWNNIQEHANLVGVISKSLGDSNDYIDIIELFS